MAANSTFVVWRRQPDGLVSATCGQPRGWSHRDRDGDTLVQVAFDELLVTDDWPAARTRIKAERIAAQMNHDIDPITEAAESNWSAR